jgi:uncharacterized protein YbjT (DUF2867 family)
MRILVTGGTGYAGSHTVAASAARVMRCACWSGIPGGSPPR